MITVIVIIVIIAALALVAVSTHNRMVRAKNLVEQSWNQIDVELNRRYDLVPNLVNTIKGATSYEKDTLEAVVSLRNQAALLAGAKADPAQRAQIEDQLSSQLRNLVTVTSEAYPDLRANAGFVQLQAELSGIESRIANARKYYNATVGDYNTMIESFPGSLMAGRGFPRAEYFQLPDQAIRQNPVVDFSGSAPMTPPTGGSPLPPFPGQAPAHPGAVTEGYAPYPGATTPGYTPAPGANPPALPAQTSAPLADPSGGAAAPAVPPASEPGYSQPDFSRPSGVPDSK